MDNSLQQVIPTRNEEFQSLQNKFKSKPEDFKIFTQSSNIKKRISLGEDALQLPITEPNETKEDNVEELKMPSVRELAMKFKSSMPVQPKPPLTPVKKISTTLLPLHQQLSTGEVQLNDSAKKSSKTLANATQNIQSSADVDQIDVHHHEPTPAKRTTIPPKQNLHQNPRPVQTLSTENSFTDQLDVDPVVPTPVKRTTAPPNKTVTEQVQPKDVFEKSESDQLDAHHQPTPTTEEDKQIEPIQEEKQVKPITEEDKQIEPIQEDKQVKVMTEQISIEKMAFKPQPPRTLEIPEKMTLDDENVFSPPLPKTPPPNKVPFLPVMPKTPPPQKNYIFSDVVDPLLSIIAPTPTEMGISPTEEILLSIIPGEINDRTISIGDSETETNSMEKFLLQHNEDDDDMKWDAFAEINNNSKKSIETKWIYKATPTEVYEKNSPLEVEKTFFGVENIETVIPSEESHEMGTKSEEEILNSKINADPISISTDEQVTSEEENTVDYSLTKINDKPLENIPTSATDADEITGTKLLYYRQTSEVNQSSASPMKPALNRTKSLPPPNLDPERRKTAMEVLATPPTFRQKEEEDLIKLRKQIVRASRSPRMATPNALAPK